MGNAETPKRRNVETSKRRNVENGAEGRRELWGEGEGSEGITSYELRIINTETQKRRNTETRGLTISNFQLPITSYELQLQGVPGWRGRGCRVDDPTYGL